MQGSLHATMKDVFTSDMCAMETMIVEIIQMSLTVTLLQLHLDQRVGQLQLHLDQRVGPTWFFPVLQKFLS